MRYRLGYKADELKGAVPTELGTVFYFIEEFNGQWVRTFPGTPNLMNALTNAASRRAGGKQTRVAGELF